jgi:hypothetical protein
VGRREAVLKNISLLRVKKDKLRALAKAEKKAAVLKNTSPRKVKKDRFKVLAEGESIPMVGIEELRNKSTRLGYVLVKVGYYHQGQDIRINVKNGGLPIWPGQKKNC